MNTVTAAVHDALTASAINSGTIWYGRGSQPSRAMQRNGPAPERNPKRSASLSSRAECASPRWR